MKCRPLTCRLARVCDSRPCVSTDFRLAPALRAGGLHHPPCQALGQPREVAVAHLGQGPVGRQVAAAQPGQGQALGQVLGQGVAQVALRAALGLAEAVGQRGGCQRDAQRRPGLPVAGGLQHGRAAEAPVREQQVFEKAAALGRLAFAGLDVDFQRQAGQRHEGRPVRRVEGQRHQRRARLDHRVPELPGQPQAPVGGADLRHGQAAGGHHQLGRTAHGCQCST